MVGLWFWEICYCIEAADCVYGQIQVGGVNYVTAAIPSQFSVGCVNGKGVYTRLTVDFGGFYVLDGLMSEKSSPLESWLLSLAGLLRNARSAEAKKRVNFHISVLDNPNLLSWPIFGNPWFKLTTEQIFCSKGGLDHKPSVVGVKLTLVLTINTCLLIDLLWNWPIFCAMSHALWLRK